MEVVNMEQKNKENSNDFLNKMLLRVSEAEEKIKNDPRIMNTIKDLAKS